MVLLAYAMKTEQIILHKYKRCPKKKMETNEVNAELQMIQVTSTSCY